MSTDPGFRGALDTLLLSLGVPLVPGGVVGGRTIIVLEGNEVDFSVVGNTSFGAANWPNLGAGFVFVPFSASVLFTALIETVPFVAVPTIQVGTNVNSNDLIATSSLSVASLHAQAGQGSHGQRTAVLVNTNIPYPTLAGAVPNCFVGTATTATTIVKAKPIVIGYIRPVF